MNIKKQVEEIRAISKEIQKTGLGEHLCDSIAVSVYDAGYRKADEFIAENEQLRVRHASLDKQIRAEARREFAEKLKNYYIKNQNSLKGSINCDLVAYHIDQILADMERKEELCL